MKKIQIIWTSIIGGIALIGSIYATATDGWTKVGDFFVENEAETVKQLKLDTIITEWEHYRKDADLPFHLQRLYVARGEHIDSTDFHVMQNTNLLFSHAFAKVKMVLDSHKCKYWFHVDPSGGLWWRDRTENNERTIPYSVTYRPTTGHFEYTDRFGNVKRLPHKWERTNNSHE